MASLVVVGAQWGDEGKGKVADFLATTADMVVRFQGGPNAGHTVAVGDYEVTFHQIPSGVLNPAARCLIGCGCVIDPLAFNRELAALVRRGLRPKGRLAVDFRTHLILPYHVQLDGCREAQAGTLRIGTTGRGIGPAYVDKFARVGIRVADLLTEETFREKLRVNIAAANFLLMERYKAEPLSYKQTVASYWRLTRPLARMATDVSQEVEAALVKDRRVLFEGAQGMHLDIDLGTYPYVTASSCWAGGVAPGVGISPVWIRDVLGVAKAYTTRVGLGPFPTEMTDEESARIRDIGHEYGATTGRPRRCGWFDAPVVRAAVRYNRLMGLVITKLDVLDSYPEIRLCHSYRVQGRLLGEFEPYHAGVYEPVYSVMPGWREPTSQCRTWRSLPLACRRYLRKIEELTGCPIISVSVGRAREQTVLVQPKRLKWLGDGASQCRG